MLIVKPFQPTGLTAWAAMVITAWNTPHEFSAFPRAADV